MSSCGTFDLSCHVSSLASDALSGLAGSIVAGVGDVVKAVTVLWMQVPTPTLASDEVGTPTDPVAFVQGSLGFYTFLLACCSMAVGLLRVAWEYRGHGQARAVKDLTRALVTFLAVKGGGLGAIWLFARGGDAFADWIIARSTGKDFGTNLAQVLGFSSTATMGLSNFLVAFLAFQAVAASVGQLLAMVGRGGALVLLSGIWPTASSFRNFEQGDAWHRRVVAWVIAALLYKPAAAVIYATGFRMTSANLFGTNGVITVVCGLLMVVGASSSLLAMAKFAVPLVAAVEARTSGGGGGGGGAGVGGVVAAGAPVVASYVGSGQPPAGSGAPSGSPPAWAGAAATPPAGAATTATTTAGSTAAGTATTAAAGAGTAGVGAAVIAGATTATAVLDKISDAGNPAAGGTA